MNKDKPLAIYKSKTPKVYKNKRLTNANFSDFTLNDYQVFLHLISKIGSVDQFGKYLQEPNVLKREHILSAKEFSKVFNVDIHYSYKILKTSIDKLMKTDIKIEKPESNTILRINVCSSAEYNKNDGKVTIEFTDKIMPYLEQTRQRFTLYNLKEIANFGSLYTTRLYELIQDFKETGWFIKSVDELRTILAVGDKLNLYADFKRKTFLHACDEINSNYDIQLRFEEIKEGRKVVAVKFIFKQFIPKQLTNTITGDLTTVYEKPKQNNVSKKIKKSKSKIDELNIIPNQMNFDDIKKELIIDNNIENSKIQNQPRSIKNILSSLFSKR